MNDIDLTPVLPDELITATGLSYRYPSGLEVLRDISLSVGKSQVVSIVGPSGCGKSTLLSVLAGIRRPAAGSVTWSAMRDTSSVKRQRVTMLFQRDTLLPWRTVAGNIELALRCSGVNGREAKIRVDEMLEIVGLREFRKSRPAELSGGMRRRAGLGVALAPRPELVLMDEPFSALDEPTRLLLHNEVLRIASESVVSLLLATHDLGEAVSLSERVYVLSRRPTTCCAVYDIDLGGSGTRDVLALREETRYQELYARVWSTLRMQITPHDESAARR
jgi:NitT/TauT family transport system ATP-binding protein